MTDYRPLFRALASHVSGFYGTLPPEVVDNSDDEDINIYELARRLKMAPLPYGHPIGVTDAVMNYRSEVQ